MIGMEEGLFPGNRAIISGDPKQIEEERRLCYVGITRAKKELFMTYALHRMQHGIIQYSAPSRFLAELPPELLDNRFKKREPVQQPRHWSFEDSIKTPKRPVVSNPYKTELPKPNKVDVYKRQYGTRRSICGYNMYFFTVFSSCRPYTYFACILCGIYSLSLIHIYKSARANNDSKFKNFWLAIVISFGFYLPVVLFADAVPAIGMFMIPKTCAYVWMVLMGYRAMKN